MQVRILPLQLMNTKTIGNITETQVLAELVKSGKDVLIPWGDNLRYDLAYVEGAKLIRVQCKTGRLCDGFVEFSCHSSQQHRGGGNKPYHGEADLFGVYCAALDTVYLVPVDNCGTSKARLRYLIPQRNQNKNVRWAKDYQLNT